MTVMSDAGQFVCDECGELSLVIFSNICRQCGQCLCDDCALEHDCRTTGDEDDDA